MAVVIIPGVEAVIQWSEVRQMYPNRWLIIEALEAETDPDHQRRLKRIAVVETCQNGDAALQSYRCLHKQHPTREFYFVPTSCELLDIRELVWDGLDSFRSIHIFSRQCRQPRR